MRRSPPRAASLRVSGGQFLVRAVAERLAGGALAAAQPYFLRFGDGELGRREFRALVRAVAERLALRTAAGAPPVVARRHLHGVRRALRHIWKMSGLRRH